MPGICSFDKYETKARGLYYRLRFDRASTAVFGDCTRVQLFKSKDYVMVKPVRGALADDRTSFLLGRNKSKAVINVGRLVSNGFLRDDMFLKKYVVKKDRKGNLYVCLGEEVEGEEQ